MTALKPWFLYLVRCKNGHLYTGITTDVSRRFKEHSDTSKNSKGAKYLRGKGPLKLEFQQSLESRSLASKLEARVKKLTVLQKEMLINNELQLMKLL